MTKTISQTDLDAIKSANLKYQQAIKTKIGVPQAKQFLANLLIAHVDALIDASTENNRLQNIINDIEDENDSLRVALVDKHKEIAELKDNIEMLKQSKPKRKGKKVADGA